MTDGPRRRGPDKGPRRSATPWATASTRSEVHLSPERWAIVDYVLARLSGGESVEAICRSQDYLDLAQAGQKMPVARTVRDWLQRDPEAQRRYQAARAMQAHALFDQILDVANDGRNDTYVDDKGRPRTAHDVVERSRLRVHALQWIVSKLLPAEYSDKTVTEQTGTVTIYHAAGFDPEALRRPRAAISSVTPRHPDGP